MPITKWTREAVLENARQFGTLQEWRKNGSAYAVALKQGWLLEATAHMKILKRVRWTDVEIFADAKKFQTIKEWRTSSNGAYSAASKRGLLEEITRLMSRSIKPNGFWTKERVLEDARKYKSRSEWMRNSSGAATMAKRNGWYEEVVASMPMLVEHGKWTKQNVINEAKKYESPIQWICSSNASYGAAIKKGWLKEASLHMMPAVRVSKWTKELVLEDAKKYSSRGEWQKAKGSAAAVAIEKGWYEEATSHMHRVYSFGEMTIYKLLTQLGINFEVQKRFKQIRSKYPLPFDFYIPDFNLVIEYQGSQHFYESTRKRNEALIDIQKRDEIKMLGAKKLELNYLSISHRQEKEIEKALISQLKEISNAQNEPQTFRKRQLNEHELILLKSLGTHTKEQVIADAKKYKTYPEWRKHSATFQTAIKNGWLDECKAHMLSEFETRSRAKLVWTKEKIHADALNYSSRVSWKKANASAYSAARTKGWLTEVTVHMQRLVKPNGYWTKQKVFQSAKKYKSRTEWMRSSDSGAYNVARENKWLEQACKHMPWLSTKPKP